ncbi:MAG: c-type cytochrome [Isosphaeraceae bacterium]|nr:c-type cytochrome [Isosphaeraceae bacterium]
MRRSLRNCVFGLLAATAGLVPPVATHAADAPPQWIWARKQAGEQDVVYFFKTFDLKDKPKSAHLAAACDNNAVVFLNGEPVAESSDWSNPTGAEVASHLNAGSNVLVVKAANAGGPAGFLLKLNLDSPGGQRTSISTDASWLTSLDAPKGDWKKRDFRPHGWGHAVSVGAWGDQPWGRVALDEAHAPAATPAEELTLPKGFRAELLYSVPRALQGSWVCMTNDPKGRLIVSDQSGSLYRVTVGASASETKVERIELAIGQAQGMLFAFDSLYVTVNGNAAQGSGFYRVRDTDGDDRLDEVKLLKKFDGGGEHGPHGIRLGPDGKLYVIAGNFTKVPDGIDPNSALRDFAEDQLLPRNPDGNGFGTGVMAPGGWIARTDKEGKQWDLFCGGFRNPYDIDFNTDGEVFTYDADMEWDVGTPWYRPTRVNHAVSGAEFGWRYGTGKWPAYYPDSVGAVADIGLGSPTGIAFGTGAKFPERYQRALYICDWTYGKLYALHMQAVGATYTASFETFVAGKPLPLTDVVVNSDGALYFTVGGRNTQSGLYRVTYVGTESTAAAPTPSDPAAAKARAARRRLEQYHVRQDPAAVDIAWPYLNSPDRALRYAARVALERQDLEQWKARALAETKTDARIQALLALTRTGDKSLQADVLARLNALPFEQLTEEQFLDALRVYGLAFIRLGGSSPEAARAVAARLGPLFPSGSEFVNRELAKVLVYVDAPGIVERAMNQLQSSQTQQDQMFYIFVLRTARHGWTVPLRRSYFGWINLADAKYVGGASFKNFLKKIRADALETLADGDRAALKDVLEGLEQSQAVRLETTRQFIHNWQTADLAPLLDQAARGRSFEKGRRAFEAAQCLKCHRFANEGGSTGPDITGVGNRFDAAYILESLVLPSKTISDQYQGSVLSLRDGKIITGRVLSEDAKSVVVRTDPFALKPVEVAKSEIEERQPSKVSEMPQGLINILTKEEILDLIAYLRSGGNRQDKSFLK